MARTDRDITRRHFVRALLGGGTMGVLLGALPRTRTFEDTRPSRFIWEEGDVQVTKRADEEVNP